MWVNERAAAKCGSAPGGQRVVSTIRPPLSLAFIFLSFYLYFFCFIFFFLKSFSFKMYFFVFCIWILFISFQLLFSFLFLSYFFLFFSMQNFLKIWNNTRANTPFAGANTCKYGVEWIWRISSQSCQRGATTGTRCAAKAG